MAHLLSWVWSAVSGALSVFLLVVSWGAFISIPFGIVGALRKRCKWSATLTYVVVCIVGSLAFRGLFWVSDRIAHDDSVSTALFWGAVLLAGLGGVPSFITLLKDNWAATNGTPSVPA